MKKATLFFSVFLSLIVGSALHAAPKDVRIDRFNLDISTDSIVAHLWFGKEVPDDDIERAFNAISMSEEYADASSAEEKKAAVAAFIDEFAEVLIDIAEDRTKDSKKTAEQISSLKNFIEKIRSQVEKNKPIAVEYVLNIVADKY